MDGGQDVAACRSLTVSGGSGRHVDVDAGRVRWTRSLLAPSWRWALCIKTAASVMAHARKVLTCLQHPLLDPSIPSGGLHLVSDLMSIVPWQASSVRDVRHTALNGML